MHWILGTLFYSLAYNSIKLFNKSIDFVQTHRYYSKKSFRPFLKQALIGLIIGDVYASRSKAHYTTRLVFWR
jgi:hypothetical protein